MLTIERPSLTHSKLIIAVIVFGVGFIGSLSALRYFQPGLEQLASGHTGSVVNHPGASASAQSQTASSDTSSNKQPASPASGTAGEIKPVASAPVDSPASSYAGGSSGTAQLAGQVAPASQSSVAPSASSPAAVTQPATGNVGQPSAPSTSSPAAPVTSLAQPVVNTASNLLPPLSTCTCGN